MFGSLDVSLSSVPLEYALTSAFLGALIALYGARRLRRTDEKGPINGTQPVPKIKGKWPGNIDILLELIYSESSDYPTEGISRWCKEYGPTFDMGILWSHQIVSGKYFSSVRRVAILVAEIRHLLADPVVSRAVLQDLDGFEKSEKWHRMVHTFLGDGIFAVDGPLWERVSGCQGVYLLPFVADRENLAPSHGPSILQSQQGGRRATTGAPCRHVTGRTSKASSPIRSLGHAGTRQDSVG